jgi:hypothetical protein
MIYWFIGKLWDTPYQIWRLNELDSLFGLCYYWAEHSFALQYNKSLARFVGTYALCYHLHFLPCLTCHLFSNEFFRTYMFEHSVLMRYLKSSYVGHLGPTSAWLIGSGDARSFYWYAKKILKGKSTAEEIVRKCVTDLYKDVLILRRTSNLETS